MKKGFTLIELVLSVLLLVILSSVMIILINPQTSISKGRDAKKISQMAKFEATIIDYKIDYDVYPDTTPPDGISYYHTDTTYEIDADLEFFTDKEQNDGGNDPLLYEIGNDLTLK